MTLDHNTAIILTAVFVALAVLFLYIGFCVNIEERITITVSDISKYRRGDLIRLYGGNNVLRIREIHAPDTIICTREERRT